MFTTALRRYAGHSTFHDFQQSLLHPFTGHIAGDRRIVRLAGDFINLVNIDDAALRPLDIIFTGLQQLQDDVFNILTHIAGLRQCGGIRHGEGHIQDPRQSLRQQSFAAPGWPNQHDIGFCQFNVTRFFSHVETLIVIVHRNREHPFGVALTNDVIIQNLTNFQRRRNALRGFQPAGFGLFTDNIHA